jgi:hypothetical protein
MTNTVIAAVDNTTTKTTTTTTTTTAAAAAAGKSFYCERRLYEICLDLSVFDILCEGKGKCHIWITVGLPLCPCICL